MCVNFVGRVFDSQNVTIRLLCVDNALRVTAKERARL